MVESVNYKPSETKTKYFFTKLVDGWTLFSLGMGAGAKMAVYNYH